MLQFNIWNKKMKINTKLLVIGIFCKSFFLYPYLLPDHWISTCLVFFRNHEYKVDISLNGIFTHSHEIINRNDNVFSDIIVIVVHEEWKPIMALFIQLTALRVQLFRLFIWNQSVFLSMDDETW